MSRTNHVVAVLAESPHLLPPGGMPYLQIPPQTSRLPGPSAYETSPLIKPFARSCGVDPTVIGITYSLGYMFSLVDVFTSKILTLLRPPFEKLTMLLKRGREAEAEAVARADYTRLLQVYRDYLPDAITY
jgi:hypothetical protein